MRKKSNSTNLFIAILFIVAALMGYNYFARPFLRNYPNQQNDSLSEEEINQEREEYVEQKLSVLDSLSAEEKVGQLIAYPYTIEIEQNALDASENDSLAGAIAATTSAQLQALEPGFITIFGSDIPKETASIHLNNISSLFTNKAVSPLFAVDHEGGDVQRLSGDGFTTLPPWRELCAADQDTRLELLTDSARELSEVGITTVFAPVLDIGSSVMGSRSCSDFDGLELAAKDFVDTFGQNQVMSVIKHFPGLGSATKDLHFSDDSITLREGDTLIFSQILNRYPNIGVMTSHVKLKDLLDGVPCSLSQECLSALPDSFPFAMVFSDALEMGALDNYAAEMVEEFDFLTLTPQELEENEDAARLIVLSYEALLAGNDVLVYGKDVGYDQILAVRNELAARLEQDEQLAARVEMSAAKLLAVKRLGGEI